MLFKKSQDKKKLTVEEIRKRARILVVDDNDFAYLELFKRDGYVIDKWDDIDDLPKIERGEFDIILLDIQGIGKELSQEQGLGVLKHIRKACPIQIVIAYSNADFSLKYQEFFKMADETLDKSSDYVEFKRIVDKLLCERFSEGFYLQRILLLANPYISDTSKLKKLSKEAIYKKDESKLERYLGMYIDNKETVTTILNIISIAIGIAAL